MKYHHLEVPTKKKLEDEKYLPHFRVYVSGYGKPPFGVEWVRFEEDADSLGIVKTLPHVACEVADIERAIEGRNVIIRQFHAFFTSI